MSVEIKVPPAGESVSEAIVAAIIKPNGTFVKQEEEIIELETEKVNQVITAPESGVVTWSVNVDDTVTIGQVIGTIDTSAKGAPPQEEKAPAPTLTPAPTEEKAPEPTPEMTHKVRETPEEFVQSLTEEKAPAPTPTPAPAAPTPPQAAPPQTPTSRRRMSGLRKTIAKRLVEVKNQTAMLTTFNEVDLKNVIEIRAKEKENFEKVHGVRLGFMSFFTTAAARALKAFPDVNSFLDGDEIVTPEHVNMGIAVSTDKGLMVPVIRGAETLSFAQIEQEIQRFAIAAREGKIGMDDLKEGTFTITNAGKFGSMLSTPILNPPQSGILGMHNIVKRPVVVDEEIVIRPIMYLALSYDHRIIDGETAVSFLMHIRRSLEEPARLMLEV